MALASHPTSSTSHELGTVGFSDVAAFNEDVEHAHVPPVVIHLELAALEPTEEARADVPATLKREPVAIRDAIPMMGGLAVDGLHEQQFEIIRRSQILGHSALCHRLLPEHRATLPSQLIPGLLIIIDDSLVETALQFFQRHASRLGGSRSVMHAIARVGQTSFKTLGHPAKERFDGSFGQSRQLHRLHL